MIIDLRTVVLITGMLHLIQVLVFVQQFRSSRTLPGPGWWLIWSLLEMVAFSAMLFRSNPILLPYIIPIQSPLNVAGTLFVYFGVRSFLKRDLNLRFMVPFFITYYLLHLYFYLIDDNIAVRTLLMDIGLFATAFLTAWNLLRFTNHRLMPAARFTALFIVLHGLIFVARSAAIISGTSAYDMQAKGGFNQIQYFDALLVGIVWTICFIIMMNERLQSEIFESREHLVHNIADLKKSKEELGVKNKELEKLNAERDKFYSIIAHDLRGPFNHFLGMTRVLADEYSGLTQQEIGKFARSMEQSAVNLFSLLEDLLSWSRVQQGLMQFRPRPVLLADEVEECKVLMLESAKKKSLAITADIDRRILVFADPAMLKTVLRNLIDNAVKFSPAEGKITVTASERADCWIEICVRDTGIGMSSEILDKLFLGNSHLPRKGTAGEPGTGIGLMLCSEFIAMHGGQIRVDSAPGKGSAFYVSLPPEEGFPI